MKKLIAVLLVALLTLCFANITLAEDSQANAVRLMEKSISGFDFQGKKDLLLLQWKKSNEDAAVASLNEGILALNQGESYRALGMLEACEKFSKNADLAVPEKLQELKKLARTQFALKMISDSVDNLKANKLSDGRRHLDMAQSSFDLATR